MRSVFSSDHVQFPSTVLLVSAPEGSFDHVSLKFVLCTCRCGPVADRGGSSIMLVVGSSGLEPPTSRLSGVRSNHLSYEPIFS